MLLASLSVPPTCTKPLHKDFIILGVLYMSMAAVEFCCVGCAGSKFIDMS